MYAWVGQNTSYWQARIYISLVQFSYFGNQHGSSLKAKNKNFKLLSYAASLDVHEGIKVSVE